MTNPEIVPSVPIIVDKEKESLFLKRDEAIKYAANFADLFPIHFAGFEHARKEPELNPSKDITPGQMKEFFQYCETTQQIAIDQLGRRSSLSEMASAALTLRGRGSELTNLHNALENRMQLVSHAILLSLAKQAAENGHDDISELLSQYQEQENIERSAGTKPTYQVNGFDGTGQAKVWLKLEPTIDSISALDKRLIFARELFRSLQSKGLGQEYLQLIGKHLGDKEDLAS